MNAGMYGMADGRGMAGRKVAASTIRTSHGSDPAGCVSGTLRAEKLTTTSLAVSTRLRIFSIQGKGAVRAAGVSAKDTAGNLTVELFVDGVRTVVHTNTAIAAAGPLLVGSFISSGICALDWVPFDSSVEIYVTQTGTNSGVDYAVAYDLHQ